MTTAEIESLLERVRSATGADRSLDFALLEMAGLSYYDYTRSWYENEASDPTQIDLTKQYWQDAPTASIDSVVALIERVLPGVETEIHLNKPNRDWQTALIRVEPLKMLAGEAATAPLALIAALLIALLHQASDKGTENAVRAKVKWPGVESKEVSA